MTEQIKPSSEPRITELEVKTHDFECPSCHGEEYWVEVPEPYQEPRWFVVCCMCSKRYQLMLDGTIQLEGHRE